MDKRCLKRHVCSQKQKACDKGQNQSRVFCDRGVDRRKLLGED